MSQIDRSQLIPDPQQPSRQPGGIQSPRPVAPAHGQQHGAANTSPRPNRGQHQQRQQRSAHGAGHNQGPSHTRVSNNRGPANNRSAKGNKTGGKTAFFVVLGLVAIVYIVGVVAFSQIAYPNTTIAGVDISLSNASRFPTPLPPLPRSTQRGSTTSSPFREMTLAGPISPNPTSPSSTARQLPTRLSAATSRCCGPRA